MNENQIHCQAPFTFHNLESQAESPQFCPWFQNVVITAQRTMCIWVTFSPNGTLNAVWFCRSFRTTRSCSNRINCAFQNSVRRVTWKEAGSFSRATKARGTWHSSDWADPTWHAKSRANRSTILRSRNAHYRYAMMWTGSYKPPCSRKNFLSFFLRSCHCGAKTNIKFTMTISKKSECS